MTAHFQIQQDGSLFLVHPLTTKAADWLQGTAPEDATFLGDALVVEARYIPEVLAAIVSEFVSRIVVTVKLPAGMTVNLN